MPDWDKLYASTQATTSKHGSQSDEAAALALIDAATEEAKKKGSEKEGEGAGGTCSLISEQSGWWDGISDG